MKAGIQPIRRRHARPSGRHALGSVLVHALAIGGGLVAVSLRPELPDFVSYQIELVALPDAQPTEIVVEAPPSPPEPEPDPEPEPEPEPPPPEPVRTEPPPRPSSSTPAPTRTPESAGAVNVRIEGLRRDYPVYYNNIIVQIQRCFRWSGGGAHSTEIYFVVEADGSVSGSRFVTQSGNPAFDYEALGAIECAGQAGRFGTLPDDLPYDRLPIRFTFRPAGIFR